MTYVLVTGGAGFIGSHFINCLPHDCNIVNFDALYYSSDLNRIKPIANYHFYKGNLRNIQDIEEVFRKFQISEIVHFAALTHVDESFSNPLEYTLDNVLGTQNLLEVSKKYKINKFIYISTDEVYGETENPKEEHDTLFPTNPYAASKAAAEMIVHSYHKCYGIPTIITRGCNAYGEKQHIEKLIPKFISLHIQHEKLTIHGSGNTRRCFIHVSDLVQAIRLLLLKGKIGHIYNIGTQEEYTVLQVADMISQQKAHLQFVPDRLYNDKRYLMTNDKITKLGWKQNIYFERGLEKLYKYAYMEDFAAKIRTLELEIQAITEDKKELKKLWTCLDFNGNGIVSLAEIDKFVIERFPLLNHKPALMRAYKKTTKKDGNGDDWVQKNEFKALLKNLIHFNRVFHIFDKIDTDDDRRIDLEEFKRGFEQLKMDTDRNSEDIFAEIDKNKGGFILFDEFSSWYAKNLRDEDLFDF